MKYCLLDRRKKEIIKTEEINTKEAKYRNQQLGGMGARTRWIPQQDVKSCLYMMNNT